MRKPRRKSGMKSIGVFVDTSTVNRILDMDAEKTNDSQYEEDRDYLTKIVEQFAEAGVIRLFVNPAVELEIEQTIDKDRRTALMRVFHKLHFTPFNKSVFPWVFPVTFLRDEEKDKLVTLLNAFPSFEKDEKVFADAVFNPRIQIILTTDRKHFKAEKFSDFLLISCLGTTM